MTLYWAWHTLQNYEEAAALARRAIRLAPGNPSLRRQLAVASYMLGDMEASRNALTEYLALMPDGTVEDARYIPSKNPQHLERFIDALRAIGLPDAYRGSPEAAAGHNLKS